MNLNFVSLNRAVEELQAGNPVIFQTDTVCGIGVSVIHAKSPGRLFELKRRKPNKPIAWLVRGERELDQFGADVRDYAKNLAHAFWPGALTLVVQASTRVPQAYLVLQTSGDLASSTTERHAQTISRKVDSHSPNSISKTIGLRSPQSETVQQLIQLVGGPICTTSANFSGCDAPTSINELDTAFARDIPVLKPAKTTAQSSSGEPQIASTVLDCMGNSPKILRAGNITKGQIAEIIA